MRRVQRLATILLSATALAPVTGWAQTASGNTASPSNDKQAISLDEVVVTARRRDERLLDVPVAISAVSGQTLSQYSVSRISDMSTLVPSLVAGKAASGSSASIFLRGVGSTALSAGFDQSVSFVVDGLPMSRGREISLPQFDVQGVEVLKGPQALYFGKNTTGGLISMTSNNPTSSFEAGVKVGYGFKARDRYGEAFVSGPLSDTLRARLAVRHSEADGAFTNTAADSYTNYVPGQVRTRNADRRGGGKASAARLTIDWDPTQALSFRLKTSLSDVKDGGPTDLIERICGGGRATPFAARGLPPSPNADCRIDGRSDSSKIPIQVAQANYRFARDGQMYSDFKSGFVALNSTYSTSKVDISSISGYYHFKQEDLDNVSGEAYPAGFSQGVDFTQYSQELRFQTKFDGRFNALFGAFYADSDFTVNQDAYIAPVPLDPVTNTYTAFKKDTGFSGKAWSIFAQGTLNLTDKLELSGGARYSHEARDSYQISRNANIAFAASFPGGIHINNRYRDHNLSPEITLRYKPEADSTIYASYKQGFKAGGFNLSQTIDLKTAAGLGGYGPETAKGGEVGLRTMRLHRALSLNVTAYHYVYSDLQVQFFDPVTISQIAGNAGKLITQGIELDATLRVPGAEGLSLRTAVAYNDAKYRDFIGQCFSGQTIAQGCDRRLVNGAYTAQDYDGKRPPKAPKVAFRGGFTYEREVSKGMSLRATSDLSYQSKYNFTDALSPTGVQKAYTKVDAAFSLIGENERWNLSLIGRNLANKLVVTAANDIPFAGGTGTGTATGVPADLSAFVDNPREISLELSFKF